MDADECDWEWQRLKLTVYLSEVDGDAFESLFQKIAKALWGPAFQATIPMGSRGDLKCDGFHLKTGYVYQCYGPRYGRVDVEDALKKIRQDFIGAKNHWQSVMTQWNFVVSLYRGKTPSEIVRLVKELSIELETPAEILHGDDLVQLVRGITPEVRRSMFGAPPLPEDMLRRVTYENIGRALAFIRADITRSPMETLELPPDADTKITFNLLPETARHFLKLGISAASRVRRYLLDHAEPHEAERMAEGFSSRYRALRAQGAEPSEIFKQLLIFAGGATGDPDREAAALAIVTHFFTTCEIFERPPLELPT
jgi:hypothetical protein